MEGSLNAMNKRVELIEVKLVVVDCRMLGSFLCKAKFGFLQVSPASLSSTDSANCLQGLK